MINMNYLEIIVGIFLIISAIFTVKSKDLMKSIIYLSLSSMIAVVAFILMKAPDIAITEAVIGSGLVTAVFLFTLSSVNKVGEKQ